MTITHRMSATPTYKSWQKMLERCRNPNAVQYKWYGGKGVAVCDRWYSFERFFEDMGPRPAGRTIDRIDSSGNYEPSNCRWATKLEQIWNQSKTIIVEYQGQRMGLSAACAAAGVPLPRTYYRMTKRGLSFADACAPEHLREKKTEERLREYARRRKEGQTNRQIAEHFSMKESGIEAWAKDARARGWL